MPRTCDNLLPVKIDYTVHLWKEGDHYIAHAMPLDVASAGDQPEMARQALDEAVRLFLATAADIGTMDQVLTDAGYERGGDGSWQSPRWIAVEHRAVAVAE